MRSKKLLTEFHGSAATDVASKKLEGQGWAYTFSKVNTVCPRDVYDNIVKASFVQVLIKGKSKASGRDQNTQIPINYINGGLINNQMG